jgi:hypothetical protein
MVDMFKLLAQVPEHKLQSVLANGYQQGVPVVKDALTFGEENGYVAIPDTRRVVLAKERDVVSTAKGGSEGRSTREASERGRERSKNHDNRRQHHQGGGGGCAGAPATVFEKVAHLLEYGVIGDMVRYKNDFYSAITADMYKAFSKRHHVLKRDMYGFVYETTSAPPTNRECLQFFAEIVETNLVVCTGGSRFVTAVDRPGGRTIVVPRDSGHLSPPYDTYDLAIAALVAEGMRETRAFAAMKLTELREYAQTYGISLGDRKKKQDIVDHLTSIE